MVALDGNFVLGCEPGTYYPLNTYISMYVITNRCYNERGSRINYVRSGIPNCTTNEHLFMTSTYLRLHRFKVRSARFQRNYNLTVFRSTPQTVMKTENKRYTYNMAVRRNNNKAPPHLHSKIMPTAQRRSDLNINGFVKQVINHPRY
jgi:hypothetical protein